MIVLRRAEEQLPCPGWEPRYAAKAVQLRDLLPWRDFVIETSWSPSVAAIEIKKSIDGPPPLSGGSDALFIGREDDGRFRFSRRISYRNSFLPMIVAVVEPSHHDGARVRVRMRLHLFVMVFVSVWIGGASLAAFMVAFIFISHGYPVGLLAAVLPLLGAAMVSIPFALEAPRAERLLRDVFARAPALPAPPETGEAYR